MNKYIAVDLGASNGRVVVGNLEGFEQTNRFETKNEVIHGSVYWDIVYIYSEIKKGIKEAFRRFGDQIVSIGIDSWGVDFGLLDSSDSLIGLPVHYRDSRTDGMVEHIFSRIPKEDLYRATGIQIMQINSLFQLAAMQQQQPELLHCAARFLSLPDLLNFWLTGVKAHEYSHTTTTQLYDPVGRQWAWEVIDAVGLDRGLFGEIVPSGTVLGPLRDDVAEELGAPSSVVVTATAEHDTASAVAAVPASEGERFLYLSSGTWSLLGTEVPDPVISGKSLQYNLTNEGAAGGNIQLLKNIMGMWIQQECIRWWEKEEQRKLEFPDLDAQTLEAADFPSFIDPNDPVFLKPNSLEGPMPRRIAAYCRERGMPEPRTKGEFMAAVYRGMTKAYAKYVGELEDVTGRAYDRIYIIGGGCRNTIVNAWTAEETGLEVAAGPAEATALGNMLVQALGRGEISSPQEGRDLIRKYHTIQMT